MMPLQSGRFGKPPTRGIAGATAALLLSGCYPWTPPALPPVTQSVARASAAVTAPERRSEARAPVTILVSIDGFRSDYLDRGITPNLSQLAATGVRGDMRPSFPSKTFPNHWTLVTGLRPDRNGIVANTMEDPARPGEQFKMATQDPFWWNAAEPIWVTAEKAGIRTATMFWPGSNIAWGGARSPEWSDEYVGGTRPSDWWPYSGALSDDRRIAAVADWLRRPAAIRPKLIALYFDEVDTAGHRYGPDAAETNAAMTAIDGMVGRLRDALAEQGQPANLVIVADHGMANTPPEHRIVLDSLLGAGSYRAIDTGAFATIVPAVGKEASVAARLARPTTGMTCWPKAQIPARFHYGRNPRVSPLFCLAKVGWTITRTATDKMDLGNHGFDNAAPEMHALFVANGPAFRPGSRVADFDNVAIAPLLRDLLGLPADPSLDGDDAPFRDVVRR